MTGDRKAVATKATGTNKPISRPKSPSGGETSSPSKASKKAAPAASGTPQKVAPASATASTVAKKTARKAPSGTGTTKSASGAPTATAKRSKSQRVITAQERWRMISENAYYRAERRGFLGGNPGEDWVAAEAEIDAELVRANTVVEP